MTATSTLGTRLRELRVDRGLSQRDVGGADLSASYVSLVESGKRSPTAAALRTMCENLGTTPQALGEGQDFEVPRSRAEVDLDLKWAKIAIRAGNPASAEKYARTVLDDASLDERDRMEALSLLAAATEGQGRLDEAITMLESLQSELDPAETRELWMSTQVTLIRCYRETGDTAHAVSLGERAMSRLGDLVRDDELMLVVSLAEAHALLGNFTRARMLLTNVISRAEAAGSNHVRGCAMWNASLVAADEGRLDDAIRLSEQALALLGESATSSTVGRLHANCAYVLLETTGWDVASKARAHLETALLHAEQEDSVGLQARLLTDVARCDVLDGDLDEAEVNLLRAYTLLHTGDEGLAAETAFARLVEAHVYIARGRLFEGLDLARRAAQETERYESAEESARTWRTVAGLAREHGDLELALEGFERASYLGGVRSTQVGLPRNGVVTSSAREDEAAETGLVARD